MLLLFILVYSDDVYFFNLNSYYVKIKCSFKLCSGVFIVYFIVNNVTLIFNRDSRTLHDYMRDFMFNVVVVICRCRAHGLLGGEERAPRHLVVRERCLGARYLLVLTAVIP